MSEKLNIEFYDEYYKLPNSLIKERDKSRECFKNKYIRSKIVNNFIYKFIPFDSNEELNNRKIQMIKNSELWASYYKYFEDKTETDITYNIYRISRKTGYHITKIKNFINMTKELNDISCFTYEITTKMWKEYANDSSGICLKFSLMDTDKFFPVVYLDKHNIDFTDMYIGAYNNQQTKTNLSYIDKLSLLPWVMKHKSYSWENELRFLCGDIYDSEDGAMGGRIFAGKKGMIQYKGTSYSYEQSGIRLMDIIIGDNCSEIYKSQLKNVL